MASAPGAGKGRWRAAARYPSSATIRWYKGVGTSRSSKTGHDDRHRRYPDRIMHSTPLEIDVVLSLSRKYLAPYCSTTIVGSIPGLNIVRVASGRRSFARHLFAFNGQTRRSPETTTTSQAKKNASRRPCNARHDQSQGQGRVTLAKCCCMSLQHME